MRQLLILIPFGLLFSLIASCDKKAQDVGVHKGERISILSFERSLIVDEDLQQLEVEIPDPYVNDSWSQPGGFPHHAAHHLALEKNIKLAFATKFVKGSTRDQRITASPIGADGKIFALGAQLDVAAIDAKTGEHIWRRSLLSKGADIEDGFGGGLAFEDGKLFIATGFGEVIALDANTGNLLWKNYLGVPFRSAPTVKEGRIFIINHENEISALSAKTGERLWSQLAIAEAASFLSSTSPAIVGDVVVAGFTSGEVMALNALNGTVLWGDSLQKAGQLTPLSDLNAIVGRVVIDKNRVFAASHGGRMVSVDLRTGERIWTTDFVSLETPWVAGEFIYLITKDSQVICLTRKEGKVRWASQLPRFEKPDEQTSPIRWVGPLLAGERLYFASSKGDIWGLSPYDGSVLWRKQIKKDAIDIAPIVFDKTFYLLTEKGNLLAYR